MSMKRRRLWWALTLVLLLAAAGYAAWSQLVKPRGEQEITFKPAHAQCGSEGPLRYCVYRDAGGVNGDVLYHLHGRKLDERSWNDASYFTAMLQGYWQTAGRKSPTVVTLSYGPVWLLTPKGRREASGLLDDVLARLPAIEAGLGPIRRRLLMGESMGGLNALILGLGSQGRFDKVAALCPGVYIDSPFASFTELRAAARRTGADPKIVFGVVQLARSYLADDAEWRRVSPLQLIDEAGPAARTRPALYLSCGLYDRYGNFEGTQRLAQQARQAGVKTDWHPLYGGHCAIDIASLGDFLVE